MHSLKYLDKLKNLQKPWCDFRIDQPFQTTFEGYSDGESIVRSIIYEEHPEMPSISLGAVPPIISPMFWETVTGLPRKNILSVTKKYKCITEVQHNRYLEMYEYQRKVIKIYLINPDSYEESIMKSLNINSYNIQEKKELVLRRINALNVMEKDISNGNWPNFLLIMPSKPIKTKDASFTVTPLLDVYLFRNEGGDDHVGRFSFLPTETVASKKMWLQRWEQAIDDYKQGRADFPATLSRPEDIPLFSKD